MLSNTRGIIGITLGSRTGILYWPCPYTPAYTEGGGGNTIRDYDHMDSYDTLYA